MVGSFIYTKARKRQLPAMTRRRDILIAGVISASKTLPRSSALYKCRSNATLQWNTWLTRAPILEWQTSSNWQTVEQCNLLCHETDVSNCCFFSTAQSKPRKSLCTLSVNKGSCKARLRRFYFDSAVGTCKLFIFGGCGGEMTRNRIVHYMHSKSIRGQGGWYP